MAGLPLSSCIPQLWSLATPAGPGLFPDSVSYGTPVPPPPGFLHTANPSPLSVVWPLKPEPQHPAPPAPVDRQASQTGECWSASFQSSVWDSLCFALHTPAAVLSSETPLSPPVRGLLTVWIIFLLHSSLPEAHILSQFLCLSFFFFFFFPCPVMLRFPCLLGSLGYSASVQ